MSNLRELVVPWIITDTHFNHLKMCQEEYCGRPLDFDCRLKEGLKLVGDNDVLIHLGDVNIGRSKWVHEKFIAPLKCKKILVRGNHDHHSNSYYIRHGWDFVCTSFKDNYYGYNILFSHMPREWDEVYDFNIHGHMHNNLVGGNLSEENKRILTERHLLLAVEYTDYKPVQLQKFLHNHKKNRTLDRIK